MTTRFAGGAAEAQVTIALRNTFEADNEDFIVRLQVSRGALQKVADIRIAWQVVVGEQLAVVDQAPPEPERTRLTKQLALAIGLPRLLTMIESEGVDEFINSHEPKVVLLTTDNVVHGARKTLAEQKACTYMQRGRTGLLCEVGEQSSPGQLVQPANATTLPVCADCGHPDDAIRCHELMHVTTEAQMFGGTGWHRNATGMCGIGQPVLAQDAHAPGRELERIGNCYLGGRTCARVYWRAPDPAALRVVTGRELLREFDNLNLVVKARTNVSPVVYLHGDTIARIAAEVRTQDEYLNAVSALAALIAAMRWGDEPEPSITAMDNFARKHGFALDSQAVRTLRHVARLRQAPPTHFTDAEAAKAAAALGIAYPPDDLAAAWQRVRAQVAWAIAAIGDSFREVAIDGSSPSAPS